MPFKTLMPLLLITFFTLSCSQKNPMDQFSKNAHFEAAMSALQIGTLVDGFDTQAVIKTIYLNQVYKNEYQTDENFYVSTYIANDPYNESMRGLRHKLYTLKLNGSKAKSIRELGEDDLLRMEMPLTEKWSRYYYVVFDHVDSNDMNITFAHKYEGTILLKYQKDALEQ